MVRDGEVMTVDEAVIDCEAVNGDDAVTGGEVVKNDVATSDDGTVSDCELVPLVFEHQHDSHVAARSTSELPLKLYLEVLAVMVAAKMHSERPEVVGVAVGQADKA